MAYLGPAIAHVKQALQLEQEGHLNEALKHFTEGIEILLKGAPTDTDPARKKAVRTRIQEYLSKAERLKQRIRDQSAQPQQQQPPSQQQQHGPAQPQPPKSPGQQPKSTGPAAKPPAQKPQSPAQPGSKPQQPQPAASPPHQAPDTDEDVSDADVAALLADFTRAISTPPQPRKPAPAVDRNLLEFDPMADDDKDAGEAPPHGELLSDDLFRPPADIKREADGAESPERPPDYDSQPEDAGAADDDDDGPKLPDVPSMSPVPKEPPGWSVEVSDSPEPSTDDAADDVPLRLPSVPHSDPDGEAGAAAKHSPRANRKPRDIFDAAVESALRDKQAPKNFLPGVDDNTKRLRAMLESIPSEDAGDATDSPGDGLDELQLPSPPSNEPLKLPSVPSDKKPGPEKKPTANDWRAMAKREEASAKHEINKTLKTAESLCDGLQDSTTRNRAALEDEMDRLTDEDNDNQDPAPPPKK